MMRQSTKKKKKRFHVRDIQDTVLNVQIFIKAETRKIFYGNFTEIWISIKILYLISNKFTNAYILIEFT